jgi:hypothetical protein
MEKTEKNNKATYLTSAFKTLAQFKIAITRPQTKKETILKTNT